MKKQFTELIGVFSALLILLVLTPNNASAQCEEGEQLHTLSVFVGGSFAPERAVELVDSEGNVTVLIECGDYPTSPTGEYVDYTFCATIGEEYTINFLDDWGDGWNFFGVDEVWTLTAGSISLGSGGNPTNDASGDASTDCTGFDIEDSITWTAEEATCTPPSFSFGSTDDCENFNYDLEITINGYGDENGVATEFVGLQLTSLNPEEYEVPELVQSQTIDAFGNPIGTVYTALEDVPLGVTIQVEILVALDSPCNSIVEFTANDECPPPNGTCDTATSIECGGTSSGSIAFAPPLPESIDGTTCGDQAFPPTVNTAGVWYSFTAPYNAVITANTNGSDFDTKLFAFGSEDCVDFECIAGDDDGGDGVDSQVSFNVTEGDQVYFLINRFSTFTTEGNYEFEVTCEELLCTDPTVELAAIDAEGNPVDGCQDIMDEFSVEITVNQADPEDPNTDYTVTANGETFEAVASGETVTAGPFTPGTLVDVNVDGNQDGLCGTSGEYQSEVCPPDNDTPCTAQTLDCETNLTATTIGATAPAEGEHCDASVGSPMVYYYFSNDAANTVRFSWQTCNEGTNFDSDSHLFTGDCESLECTPMEGQSSSTFNPGYIDAQLNPETGTSVADCQDATSIFATGGSVILNPGEDMYLGINSFSFSGGTGTFVLTTSCEDILCISPEISAIAADAEGNEINECQDVSDEFFVEGSLSGGEGNDTYNVTANGESQDVAAGGSFTFGPYNAGTQVNISAEGIEDDNCSADASVGTDVCPPLNDTACDAQALECGVPVDGTNIGASSQERCGFGGERPGVWYTLEVVEESLVQLETCQGITNFDTDISVFTGADCNDLTCFSGFSGDGYIDGPLGCDVQSWAAGGPDAEFLAPPGTYYIFVHGIGTTTTGSFTLSAVCQNVACSPDVTATAVADAEGTPIDGCIEQDGEYYVNVSITNGIESESYQVSINGDNLGDPIANDESIVVGPIGATTVANVSVNGVNDATCAGDAVTSLSNICPPANDVPCEAVTLTNDGSINGPYLNEDATGDDGEVFPAGTDCINGWCAFDNTPNNSLWFEVVVPEGFTRMEISTCVEGTNHDTQLAAWRADDCNDYGTYTEVGANDDALGGCDTQIFASTMELCDLVPGETLLIQAEGFGTATGAIAITAQGIETALCDCELPVAEVATFPDCTDPDNPSYFAELTFEEFGSSESYEVSYTVDGEDFLIEALTEDLTIENIPLGDVFTVTLVPSDPACASFGNLTATVSQPTTACDPDCNDVPGGPAVPGAACETDGGDPGILNDDCECIATPANDLPCNAEVLECGDVTSGSNVAASVSEDFCNFSVSSGGVWYQYTATGDGVVTIETCLEGTDFDTDSHVFTGSCDELSCYSGYGGEGYVDGDSGCEFTSWSTGGEFPVESGETYWIMINGFGTLTGNFELSLTCELDDEVSIDGSVNWNSNCGERAATLELYEAGTANFAASYDVTVDADGNFSAAVSETGSHDLYLKVDGYLAKVSAGVDIALGANAVAFGAITPGDITGNNAIGIGDFSGISTAYGTDEGDSAYNELADFNCDGTINIQDYSSFSSNYGSVGDEPGL